MSIDLDAIRQRAEAATRGPWKLVTDTCDCGDYGCQHGTFPYALRLPTHKLRDADLPCAPGDPGDSHRHHFSDISDLPMADVEFLAAARGDVPALLAEVDRLRAELDTMREVARGNKRHVADLTAMVERADGWLIWSHKHNAWWGANCQGYTGDTMAAGRYTLEKAQKEADFGWESDDRPAGVVVAAPSLDLIGTHELRHIMGRRIREATATAIADRKAKVGGAA